MLCYIGHKVVITLRDGSAVRGKLGFSWAPGFVKVRSPESLDGDEPQEIPGIILIPRTQVLIAQVL